MWPVCMGSRNWTLAIIYSFDVIEAASSGQLPPSNHPRYR